MHVENQAFTSSIVTAKMTGMLCVTLAELTVIGRRQDNEKKIAF